MVMDTRVAKKKLLFNFDKQYFIFYNVFDKQYFIFCNVHKFKMNI